jgi:hypothetical protein
MKMMKRILLLKTITIAFFLLAGVGSAWGQKATHFTESFSDLANSYTNGDVTLPSGTWNLTAIYGESSNNSYGGTGKAARFNDDTPNAQLTTPSVNSVGTISFYYRELNSGGGTFEVFKSIDGGSWTSIATQSFSGTTYQLYSFDVNDASNNIRLKIENDDNPGHLIVDELTLTDYTGSPTPTVTVNPSTLTGFTYLEGNGPSAEQTFTVEGSNLTNNITIAASTNYEISETSGSGYTSPITLTPIGGTVNSTTIYVRLIAGLSAGTYNEDITCSSTNATPKTVACSGEVTAPVTPPYSEDFSDCGTQQWIAVSVASNRDWTCGSGYQEINGFGGDVASDDYLISPVFDLDQTSDEVLTFQSWTRYADVSYPRVELLYTTNYTGDPSTTTWNNSLNASVTWSAEDSQVWTPSGDIDISGISGTAVRFAFHYTSSGTGGGTTSLWRIDDISIEEAPLADEPTNHPTGFSATANSPVQITVEWTDAAAGSQAPSGYLILANTSGTFTDPVDGTAQTDDTDLSDNEGVINIGTGVETYVWQGLTANTQYFFKIFSYNGTGATINYKTDGTVPTANATTDAEPDNDTEVYGGTQPLAKNISSLVDTPIEGEDVNVFVITIEDQGSGDGLPTKVTNIRVKPHSTNTADWTDAIQGVFVDDGIDFVYPTATIKDTYIDLAFTSGDLDIPDNSSLDITIYIYLNTSGIVDGDIISFMVDADDHGFTADDTGSGFATSFLLEDFNSNDMTIDVEATELTFIQQPSNVNVDAVMSPAVTVAFADENGNVDVDYDGAGFEIDLSTTGTFSGSATTEVAPSNGIATFDNIIFSADGIGISITATDENEWVTSSSIQSNTFNVTDLPKLIISEVADPDDVYQARFVELYNAGETTIDFDTDTWYLSRETNGGSSWEDKQLTGSIAPGGTYVLANSNDDINDFFYQNFGFMADFDFGGSSGNGDDGYYLYSDGDHTTGTLVDAYGVIGIDGTGEPWEYEDARAVRNSNITSPNATWTASEWTITAADVADCTPGEHNGNVSWKGGTGNWNTAANWSNGTVPSASDNIIIPDGASLSVDVAATVNNINVQNGGELTINASQSLSVSGTITIESGGSFINQGTLDDGLAKGDADAVVQRSINAYTAAANGWHLLSSPVATFNINDNAGIDPGADDDFYRFNEVTYTWMNHKQGDPSQMVPGTGYLVAYETTATKEFTGTLNNAAIPYSGLSKTTGQGEGWHLVGNPFQSAIKWNDPVGDWNLSNINGIAKLMDNEGSFVDLIAETSLIIPAMQGFWVQAENATNSFTIPLTARIHDDREWLKSGNSNLLVLTASDTETGMKQGSWVRFIAEATAGFDTKYDSRFMAWQAPQFYSMIEDEQLSTNTYPSLDEQMVIPFGFEKNEASSFSIELLESPEGKIIYLTDNQTGVQHNLSENPVYHFTSSEGDNPNRFLIHFGALSLDESSIQTAAHAYVYNSSLYVLNASGQTQVDIIDLQGRTLQSSSFRVEGLYSQPISLPTGVYVVRVMDEKGVRTAKVVVE